MIYEITGTELHGVFMSLVMLIIAIPLLIYSKKKDGSRDLIGTLLGVTLALGGGLSTWRLTSQSISNYYDYVNGRMKIQSISGVIREFAADGTDDFIRFESGKTFTYKVYRNTECLLHDISTLKGVEIGKKVKITFRDPEGRDYVNCVLKIEVLN